MGAEFGVWRLEFGVWSSEFGFVSCFGLLLGLFLASGSDFGVRSSEFGVWCLESDVFIFATLFGCDAETLVLRF